MYDAVKIPHLLKGSEEITALKSQVSVSAIAQRSPNVTARASVKHDWIDSRQGILRVCIKGRQREHAVKLNTSDILHFPIWGSGHGLEVQFTFALQSHL